MLMGGKEVKIHCCYSNLIHSLTHSPGFRKPRETNKMTSMHSSEKAHAVRNSFNNQHICVTVPFMNAVKWINKLNLLSLAFNRIAVFQTNSIFSDSERTILCWKLYVQGRNSFFLFIFLLRDNCFTEFCCLLSNLNMNQPKIYTDIPSLLNLLLISLPILPL